MKDKKDRYDSHESDKIGEKGELLEKKNIKYKFELGTFIDLHDRFKFFPAQEDDSTTREKTRCYIKFMLTV